MISKTGHKRIKNAKNDRHIIQGSVKKSNINILAKSEKGWGRDLNYNNALRGPIRAKRGGRGHAKRGI